MHWARRRAATVWVLIVGWLCGAAHSDGAPLDDLPAIDASQATTVQDSPRQWYDISLLDLEGQGWSDVKSRYDRLPAKALGVVREPVWNLAQNSAGLCARFVTDATVISARWSLRSENLAMNHMPATGVSGLDLYVRLDDGTWHWLSVGRPSTYPLNQQDLVNGLPDGRHEFLLYLPLYNGVESVQIGIPAESMLAKAPARDAGHAKPICVYGTSITQGGCASRPGMAYPAILGRWLDRPVINLGFSGNGPMDPEVVALMAELDPALYLIDCLPNMDAAKVSERTEPLVRTLRQAHPETPIVLVENITYQGAIRIPGLREAYTSKNIELRRIFESLRSAGDTYLHLVPGENLLGQDGEATVDGTHPNDLGFQRMAEVLLPVVRELVDK